MLSIHDPDAVQRALWTCCHEKRSRSRRLCRHGPGTHVHPAPDLDAGPYAGCAQPGQVDDYQRIIVCWGDRSGVGFSTRPVHRRLIGSVAIWAQDSWPKLMSQAHNTATSSPATLADVQDRAWWQPPFSFTQDIGTFIMWDEFPPLTHGDIEALPCTE